MTYKPSGNCNDPAPNIQSTPTLLLPGRSLSTVASLVRRHNKRAKRLALPATLTEAQWYDRLSQTGCTCAFCGGPYESLEHIIPLHMGLAGTTYENCVPACFTCNEYRNIVARALPHLAKPLVADLLEYAA